MSINWNNIRPLNNSLNDGFEELVCQLAAKAKIKDQQKFWRMGKPDGGKECYWKMADGSLVMWQAKYFTTSLGATQWTQINESVKTAIDNHPNLVKYCLCLPMDMPDPKLKGKTSMLSKWNTKTKEWELYANAKGISVEFEYWGSSELITRLSKKENEGLKYFWFNKEEFEDDWFDKKNLESITALGVRYTKELNVNLPISKVFDGLSRDKDFESQLHGVYKKMHEKYRGIHISTNNRKIKKALTELSDAVKSFRNVYVPFDFTGNEKIPFADYKQLLEGCLSIATDIRSILYDLRDKAEKKQTAKDHYNRPFSWEINSISSFYSSTSEFNYFLSNPVCQLANRPFLLVRGKAGTGKSHLLADIVSRRAEKGQQSLLLLGENFSTEEMPWTQILHNQLRKTQIDEFAFLGALNAKAESLQSRIIIFIDAINEGNGRKVWINRLRIFIQSIEKYPWLGLVVSIRSSFEKLIVPQEEIGTDIIIRVNHNGFAGNEYEAVKLFFMHYHITLPASPFLNPEFQNPLFLKLFCKSLFEKGLHHVPDGYDGITRIIDFFLESINTKLSKPDGLYYDERKQLVKAVVEKILLKMVDQGTDYLKFDEADVIVDGIFKNACSKQEPYLLRLISEGVFNEDLHWNEKNKPVYVIYFAYQRFQDHLTVSFLLDRHLDEKKPVFSFSSGRLHSIIKDQRTANNNQHLIEALSIQLPERINMELFEVAPHAKMYDAIADGFIQSLGWRRDDTIGKKSKAYVKEVVLNDIDLFTQFLEVSILNSMKPGFSFNAEWLHLFLIGFSLPERDHLWTTWLQNKYGEDTQDVTAVKRMIEYAWSENRHGHLHDDSVLLGCITLSWFFTSANRYLRDAATKSLVCFLQNRIHLIIPLLERFKNVSDPYVIERIYCAAYGAVLRTGTHKNMESLSEYIYAELFMGKEVFPHILLRDYARGIIEYTFYCRLSPKLDIKKVRPPYSSKPLPKKYPSTAAIDKKYEPKKDTGNYGKENWGATAILMSMTTEYGRGTARYGDFGRYTFQAALDDWNVDYDGLGNYAVQRIFELGYDPKLFSSFDSEQGSGRGAGYKERIGKKYQWIIFYELLARVSDHCLLMDESSWGRPKKAMAYEGPWYPYVRDIDPTLIIKETLAERYADKFSVHWWFNQAYSPWNVEAKKWITDRKDLPQPPGILEVKDTNNIPWIWLEIHPEWGEEEPLGEDRYHVLRKRLWYQMRSYFIKKEAVGNFKKSMNKDFYRGDLPEARNMYRVFNREFYWSPAFMFFNKPYYSGAEWIKVGSQDSKQNTTEVHRTAEYFLWEEEFDCSKSSAIHFYKPVDFIVRTLKLKPSANEGELIDASGELICFDPSVSNKSISGLLIRKEALLEFLEKEGLVLCWSVIGEKQILGNFRTNKEYPGRLNISGLYTLDKDGISGKLSFEKE